MLFEKIHLEADEKLLKVVRKHWFYLFIRSFWIISSALLPLLAWLFLVYADLSLDWRLGQYGLYFTYCYSIWLLFHWMALAHVYTDYHLDIWAVTDRRIIVIEQVAFFKRHNGSFRLEKLQDMNVEIDGILATLLHYGTIEAQTASGSEEEFRENYIPRPRELKSLILAAADKRLERQYSSTSQE